MFKVLTRSLFGLIAVAFLANTPAVFASSNRYTCEGDTCNCSGDKDCNDMFSHGACSDLLSYCTKDTAGRVFCECLKRQLPPNASAKIINRLAFIILAVDQQAGKVTVQATPSERVRIPLPAALLKRVKAGDKVFVSEASPLLKNGKLIGEAVSTKKNP